MRPHPGIISGKLRTRLMTRMLGIYYVWMNGKLQNVEYQRLW